MRSMLNEGGNRTANNYSLLIAVVISLIYYVGVQVNASTRAVRSAAANDANVAMQSWYLEIGGNRQISDPWTNTMLDPDDLSSEDEFQFLMMTHAGFLGFQIIFYSPRRERSTHPSPMR